MRRNSIRQNWKEFLSLKGNRIKLFITVIVLAGVLLSLTAFLNYVEAREGVVLNDPLLRLFAPIDLTWLIFALLYCSIVLAVVSFVAKPEQLVMAFQVYALMVILRIIAMYLVPLNPPEDTIILADPFVEYLGTGRTLTKDLFFSGHTATLFMLFLVTEKRILKNIFFISTILLGISVLLQHIHYTIDVFAAPVFAYAAFRGRTSIKNTYRNIFS